MEKVLVIFDYNLWGKDGIMSKLYYNDYFKENKINYKQGYYNVVTLPCGSGKTYHCLDFITEKREYAKRMGKESDLSKCLYVTDTSALKESVIHAYQNKTGKRVENTKNIEVITYAKLSVMLFQGGAIALSQKYDYIFLDEIHQLFLYSNRYDSFDEEVAEYNTIVEGLPLMVDNTTLICLSATPKPLVQYLEEIEESDKIYNVIPATDFSHIKAYTTTHDIPVFDTQSIIENIKLKQEDKLFIFAKTIRELKHLQEICENKGYSTLALWSIKYNHLHSDDELEEMKLNEKRMNDYQLVAREKLLQTGEYDEQVILLNGAYESGINIENGKDSEQRTVHVVVCNSCEYAITQARGRVRHDIDCLYYLSHDWYESEGKGVESNQALMDRLTNLFNITQDEPMTFMGKEGLNKMANILNIWITKIDSKGRNKGRCQAKSMKSINNHLLLLQLPFYVEVMHRKVVIDGKRRNVNLYYIDDERLWDEEE